MYAFKHKLKKGSFLFKTNNRFEKTGRKSVVYR